MIVPVLELEGPDRVVLEQGGVVDEQAGVREVGEKPADDVRRRIRLAQVAPIAVGLAARLTEFRGNRLSAASSDAP